MLGGCIVWANQGAAVRAPEAHGLIRIHAFSVFTRWNVSKILFDIFLF